MIAKFEPKVSQNKSDACVQVLVAGISLTASAEKAMLERRAFERAAAGEPGFALRIGQQTFERRLDSRICVSVREHVKRFAASGAKRWRLPRPTDRPPSLAWPAITLPHGIREEDVISQ